MLINHQLILLITEWIGAISFAVSGSLVAIRHDLDLFGVITVGLITACGGGVMRDLMLGNIPPKIFSKPHIIMAAMLVSLLIFVCAYIYRKKFKRFSRRVDKVNILFGAFGIAAFSIAGIENAYLASMQNNHFLVIFMGVISSVGGGVLRDVLVNEKPYIFTKHVYAVVAVLGCALYHFMNLYVNNVLLATVCVMLFVVTGRILAATFHLQLPKVEFDHEGNKIEK